MRKIVSSVVSHEKSEMRLKNKVQYGSSTEECKPKRRKMFASEEGYGTPKYFLIRKLLLQNEDEVL